MAWRIHHSHVDVPCVAERGFAAAFTRPRCDGHDPTGTTESVRDAVTALLTTLGISYDPVGDNGDWLWCLGGPDLVRTEAHADYAEQDMCVDLTMWVCPRHRIVTARIWPHDFATEWCDLEPPHERRSEPADLGEDPAAALSRPLEDWLRTILVLPA